VVDELVSALQDVSLSSGVDIKTILQGLKTTRGSGSGTGLTPTQTQQPLPTPSTFTEKQLLDAMRSGLGNTLVKQIIDTGASSPLPPPKTPTG
jgi:hypothetical protein